MIFPGIKNIGKEKRWWHAKNLIAGIENNYLINLGDGNGFKLILFVVPLAREKQHIQYLVLKR